MTANRHRNALGDACTNEVSTPVRRMSWSRRVERSVAASQSPARLLALSHAPRKSASRLPLSCRKNTHGQRG